MTARLGHARELVDGRFVRNAAAHKSGLRVLFGAIWIVVGSFKYRPGFARQFSVGGSPSPAWLQGGFPSGRGS